MASQQSKILKEILNQRKDEVKKLEECVREWETKEMDLERQYQEKHKVHFYFSCCFSLLLLLLFFFSKALSLIFPVLFLRYNNLQ